MGVDGGGDGVEKGRRMPDPTFVERAEEVLGDRGVTEGGGGIRRGNRGWRRGFGSGRGGRRPRTLSIPMSAG